MRPMGPLSTRELTGPVVLLCYIIKSNMPATPRSRKSNIQRIRYGDNHVKKEKEPKCWTCGSMPWRVKGIKCKGTKTVEIDGEKKKVPCGLRYQDEGPIEVPFNPLQSMLGSWDK